MPIFYHYFVQTQTCRFNKLIPYTKCVILFDMKIFLFM